MGMSHLKIMTLLNPTTRLDPKLVQSTSSQPILQDPMTVKYAAPHTHTMPIHYYHAGSIKRAKCKSFMQQIYIFPALQTQNKKTGSTPSHQGHAHAINSPLKTVQRGNNRG